MTDLATMLRARIVAHGPLGLDSWMAACNSHYYASRDPFGPAGDFTTAPEISQMFGELIGAWVADLWTRAGRPPCRLVELGPGRGTLIADAWRVCSRTPGFAEKVALHLVETSHTLRAGQAARIAAAWHDSLDDIPHDRPLIVIANEFLDALPIRQFLGAGHERAIGLEGDDFVASTIPSGFCDKGEACEPATALAAALAKRLQTGGGAALFIDYGYTGSPALDSLQAVRHHARADPFADPGAADLTAHVDFTAFAGAASGVRVAGPVAQGVWLTRLGIEPRAAALKAGATPRDAARIEAALIRLTAPAAMGALFKVIALTAADWPAPAGFDA